MLTGYEHNYPPGTMCELTAPRPYTEASAAIFNSNIGC